jgi:hypothetical protein
MVTSSGVLLQNTSVITLGQRLHYNGGVITFIASGWQNHRKTHAENMKYRHLQRNILLFHTFIWNNNLHILSCKCFIEEPGIKSSTIQKNKPEWKNSLPTLQPWVNHNLKHHADSHHLIMYIQRHRPCCLICQLLQFRFCFLCPRRVFFSIRQLLFTICQVTSQLVYLLRMGFCIRKCCTLYTQMLHLNTGLLFLAICQILQRRNWNCVPLSRYILRLVKWCILRLVKWGILAGVMIYLQQRPVVVRFETPGWRS